VRRLTIAEYDNTVRDLLNDTSAPAAKTFPPEELDYGFTNSAYARTVSDVLIEQYETAASVLATTAVAQLPALLGCNPATVGEDACFRSFLDVRPAVLSATSPARRNRSLAHFLFDDEGSV
jgi:hypothetical protein